MSPTDPDTTWSTRYRGARDALGRALGGHLRHELWMFRRYGPWVVLAMVLLYAWSLVDVPGWFR